MVSEKIISLLTVFGLFLVKSHVADETNSHQDYGNNLEAKKWKEVYKNVQKYNLLNENSTETFLNAELPYPNVYDNSNDTYYYDDEDEEDEDEEEDDEEEDDEEEDEEKKEDEEENEEESLKNKGVKRVNSYERYGVQQECQEGCHCDDFTLVCNDSNVFAHFQNFSYAPYVRSM